MSTDIQDEQDGYCSRIMARIPQLWYPLLAALFLFALWLRWPYPAPEWTHVDEWVFLLNPLKLWSGDLNPHFFIYPTLHIYLCSALYYLYYLLWYTEPVGQFVAYRFFIDGGDLLAIARGFNTILSAATVLVVAALGRRIYDRLGGLLAGLFFAVLPLSVRFAHLASTDSAAVLWISLALLGSISIVQQGRTADYVLAGICAGLAGATKYPAALVCVPLALACFLRMPTLRQQGIWLAAGLAIATFALASPYFLLDAERAWQEFSQMGQFHIMSRGGATDIPSEWYYLRYALGYGVGLIGLVAAGVGLVWPQRNKEEWVILAATGTFVALLVAAESVFMRYALPMAPLCALLWTRLLWRRRGWVLAVAVSALVAEPLYASLQTRQLLSGTDTREEAIEWLHEHVASGAKVVNLPRLVGNIEVLYSEFVFAREIRFMHNFSVRDLLAAYDNLARHDNLPPFYTYLKPQGIITPAVSLQDDAPGEAFVLWYQHPACPVVDGEGERALLEQCTWVEEFSPGDMVQSVYEPVDWYFVPIGDFAAIKKTGPLIRLGRVKVGELSGQGEAKDLFKILHGILKGKVLTAEGAWEEALSVYAEVERIPLDLFAVLNISYLYEYFYSYGLCYSKLGEVEQALGYWELAVQLKADVAELRNNMGAGYARLGREAQAVEHLAAAVKLDPQYAEAHFNLGNVFYRQGDREGALAAWQQTVAVDPDFAKAHFNLGNMHYAHRDWPRALSAFRKASALTPGDSRIFYNIAQAHLQQAEPDSAILALHKVVELDTDDAETHFRLGVLYMQTGKEKTARPWLEKALQLEPEHSRALQIRSLLERNL